MFHFNWKETFLTAESILESERSEHPVLEEYDWTLRCFYILEESFTGFPKSRWFTREFKQQDLRQEHGLHDLMDTLQPMGSVRWWWEPCSVSILQAPPHTLPVPSPVSHVLPKPHSHHLTPSSPAWAVLTAYWQLSELTPSPQANPFPYKVIFLKQQWRTFHSSPQKPSRPPAPSHCLYHKPQMPKPIVSGCTTSEVRVSTGSWFCHLLSFWSWANH